MSERTPGPWTAVGTSVRDYNCNPEDGWPNGRLIATCGSDTAGGLSTRAANARLIAAAPDLLAACEAAAEFIRNGAGLGCIARPVPGSRESTTLAVLQAAIARARGETK